MDFDLRVKALTRLAESSTPTAAETLREEFGKIASALSSSSDYEELKQSLDLLETFAYRHSSDATVQLLKFLREIEVRKLTYGDHEALWIKQIEKYQNAQSLMVRALEVLMTLRYLEPKPILHAALDLSVHVENLVSKKAISALREMARYNLRVFYGTDSQPGIGARPQEIVITELEALSDEQLIRYLSAVEAVAGALLSPTMEGTSWSYKSVTISTAVTPAVQAVGNVRAKAIQLLQRLYLVVETISQKLSVIAVLNEGARTSHVGQTDDAARDMVASNAVEVLRFYRQLAKSESLQIIQKIEHNAYWIFFHATNSEVERAALAVRDEINVNSEYQIYKVLVGFEGIFDKWDRAKATREDFQETDKFRNQKASDFAASINETNYDEWRVRILEYARTQSDDLATFPFFYRFLERFALANPKLAQRLLLENTEGLEGFLIPMLRGLWAGPNQADVRRMLENWLAAGRYLQPVIRLFLDNERLDRELLLAALRRSIEKRDQWAVASVISVAASNYARDKDFLREQLFLPALEVLTNSQNPRWINDIWFRREIRVLIADLNTEGIDQLLNNLFLLPEIDFHAEEILYLIASKAPERVLTFFLRRLSKESNEADFDAVPYSFHKLNEPLSKAPTSAVRAVANHYDGNYGMLIYQGAQLLKNIFPTFPPEFEAELLNLIKQGGNRNFEVVLAVLRNYQGQPFTHNVAKAIVRAVRTNKKYLTEVEVALQSTGVVTGEYGFANAYEAKREELKAWLTDSDDAVQEFARTYLSHLERMIEEERKRVTEEIVLRKHKYGE